MAQPIDLEDLPDKARTAGTTAGAEKFAEYSRTASKGGLNMAYEDCKVPMDDDEYLDMIFTSFSADELAIFAKNHGISVSSKQLRNLLQKKKKPVPIAGEVEHDEPIKKDVVSVHFDDVNKKKEED
jgi:hypothetical protein